MDIIRSALGACQFKKAVLEEPYLLGVLRNNTGMIVVRGMRDTYVARLKTDVVLRNAALLELPLERKKGKWASYASLLGQAGKSNP